MDSQMQACINGFVCMICGKCMSRPDTMRRHMKDIHNSSDTDYHCPACNKYFKATSTNTSAITIRVGRLREGIMMSLL